MAEPPGFKAFEKRIEELIDTSSSISPARMLSLLHRADRNPHLDVTKEIDELKNAAGATREE